MPSHDDVADMLDAAIAELEHELAPIGGNAPIGKTRGWEYGTARLSVQSPSRYDGLTRFQLLAFLKGLKSCGECFGHFEVQMVFWDGALTRPERGGAVLEKREGVGGRGAGVR